MFLDRLESGVLLLETQQGLLRVELSTRQRIYLLWTFRNFRQLSVPLLNPRQRALVNDLFHNRADIVPDSYNRSLVIGVVENFVPPAASMDGSPVEKAVQEPTLEPERLNEERQEPIAGLPVEIAAQPDLAPSPSRKFVWPTFVWPAFASPTWDWSKLVTSKLATTVGALCLCFISVGAWHRMQSVQASQAHNPTRIEHINAVAKPDSSRPEEPAATAETAIAATPAITTPLIAIPESPVTPPSIAADVPAHVPVAQSNSVSPRKPMVSVHHAASTPALSASGRDSGIGIQATRPPLRFAYPDYADVRARGVVALTAGVDCDGAVRTVRVISGNRALAAAAVQAVRHWHYRPYLKDGQPVATETNIVISYFASDAISMSFPPSIPSTH